MTLLAEPALGALCALGSACLWAVTSLLVRTLAPTFNAVAVNALRSTAAGVLLLAIVLASRGLDGLRAVSATSFALLALSIVVAMAVGDTVFFDSTRRLGLARGMTIAMTYPLLAAVLAAVFLDEPLTVRVALGSALTLCGLGLIVVRREPEAPPDGWWLGVGGAALASATWAVSVVLLRAPLREIDAVTAQALRLPLAGAVLFATPWARGALGAVRASDGPARVRLGALTALTAASGVLYAAGVKYGGVAVAAVLSSTAPMFALPLGLLFLGERLRPAAVAGTAVTIAGIAVLQA